MLQGDHWHPEAETEFWERLEYQKVHYPELASEWLATVKKSVAFVLDDPIRNREREFGHRRVNLGKFPHYLAYIVKDDKVWFIALGSGSQDPLYWKSRIEE